MNRATPFLCVCMAVLSLLASSTASADWLAVEPGTKISLQINVHGTIVVRPIGGIWSHPLCSDVTGAVVLELDWHSDKMDDLLQILTTAATAGSLVNFNALEDTCYSNGFPIIRGVKIQAP